MPATRTARRIVGVLSASTSIVILAACTSTTSPSAHQHDSGKPVTGGTLNVGLDYAPTCIDPHQTTTTAALNPARSYVDSLLDQDPKTGKLVPWLAQSWTVDSDATEYTFKLRPNVTFSDGEPVNAAAVKANLDGIVKLGALSPRGSTYLADYTGTTVVDDLTAEVRFAKPNVPFLQSTTLTVMGMLAPKSLAQQPGDLCQGKGLIGSGPFVLDNFAPNEGITVSKRKDYAWPSALYTHKGAAYLDKIAFKIIPDASVRAGSLASRQVDTTMGIAVDSESSVKASGATLLTRASPGIVTTLQVNLKHPLMADEQIRQAMQLALNRQEIRDTLLSNSYAPVKSILSATTLGFTDLSQYLGFDPAKAKSILDQDGWTADSGGIRAKNGQRLVVKACYSTPTWDRLAPLLQQEFKAVGIDFQPTGIGSTQFSSTLHSGLYDMCEANGSSTDPDLLRNYYNTQFMNYLGLSSTDPLNADLAKQATMADSSARMALVKQIQQTLVSGAFVLPIAEQTQVQGVNGNVHGLEFNAGSQLVFYDTWKS